LEKLREAHPDMPVVMFSDYKNEEAESRARAMGVATIVAKPKKLQVFADDDESDAERADAGVLRALNDAVEGAVKPVGQAMPAPAPVGYRFEGPPRAPGDGPTTDDRIPTADDRQPTTDHRTPTAEHRLPTTDHRASATDDPSPPLHSRRPRCLRRRKRPGPGRDRRRDLGATRHETQLSNLRSMLAELIDRRTATPSPCSFFASRAMSSSVVAYSSRLGVPLSAWAGSSSTRE